MYPQIPELLEWQEQREIVIVGLRSLADLLDNHHKKATKTVIAGSTASVGGTTVGLAAMALAPFTGGASLIPGAVIAGGSSLIGTATSLGSYLSERKKKGKVFKDVDSLLEEDKRYTEKVLKIASRLDEVQDSLQQYLTDLVESELGVLERAPQQAECSLAQGSANFIALPHKDLPTSSSDIDVQQLKGIFTSQLPTLAMKGLQVARRANLINIKQMFQVGKDALKGGLKAGKGTLTGFRIGKAVSIGGGVMSAALLPLEIIDLVKRVKDLKEDRGHPDSGEILSHAEKLQDGINAIREELYANVTAMNNLVLLIRYIKQLKCSDQLSSFFNIILKKLLPVKDLIKAFDKLECQNGDNVTFTLNEEELSGMLINYSGVKDSIFKELAVAVWVAGKMGSKSFVFLQNTCFTVAPPLWSLFGISFNSFGTKSERGVTILLPFDFAGDIVSEHVFQDTSNQMSDWTGRCILLNISLMDIKYTLVNLLAPDGSTDRTLFLQEITSFIKRHAEGKIVIAANFQPEVQNMTVSVKKKKVCPNTPWSMMEKFVPYRQVSEYLINVLPFHADEPGMKVFEVCKSFTVGNPEEVHIEWKACDKPVVSSEDCCNQVDAVLGLGLTALWKKMNPHTTEFSSETAVSRGVVACTMLLDFYIDSDVEMEIKSCFLDHDLRFLGFLKEAVLQFGRKSKYQT